VLVVQVELDGIEATYAAERATARFLT
jgi:hypothetical protein